MQERRHQAARVEAHAREQMRDLDGMEDVGFAAAPVLALMGLGTEQVGAINLGDIARLEIALELHTQVGDVETIAGGRFSLRFRWPRHRRRGRGG